MVKVLFLHPDLGIGGAERLVVDAALALKSKNHEVEIVTCHHDPKHCFQETRDGSLKVTSVGDWLPRSIFGKCYALCAYIRMIYAALYVTLVFAKQHFNPDVIFCDQISACVPFLRMSGSARIVFYCHFPDQLLTQRRSLLKSIYRKPIDWFEEKTTGMADVVLVNSKFTAGVFHDTFRSLSITPDVLYPSLNVSQFDRDDLALDKQDSDTFVFLSINRYERKKNLPLALKAFSVLKNQISNHENRSVRLIMAGGYDSRVTENLEHFSELTNLADDLGLSVDDVTFLKSPSDVEKLRLLKTSFALLYTPSGEHFGIVPIEAMYCQLPVVAVNDGGPTETVHDGVTGYLCKPEPESFAQAMKTLIDGGEDLKIKLGGNGRNRVLKHFSFNIFASQLNDIVKAGR